MRRQAKDEAMYRSASRIKKSASKKLSPISKEELHDVFAKYK